MADAPRILAGRYEVGELIGRGGMAEVHIGHDARLGRTVAIKILRSDLARDPSFQARFRREAQAAASLNHPAIVAVYDTGEETYTDQHTGAVAHVPFIVMEYVEGHTVQEIVRDGHAVPIDEAIEIVSGVLSALEYSHQAGIVHRDIKPANVMLTPTGAVKVMDFGIARAMADSAATMTQTQAVIGTAQYLSPEQARGETVDTRSDLYSTGCLLFELLTGRPPFMGDSPVAVAYQHVREAPPLPSSIAGDLPETLDRITLRALAKERDARYSNAAEFRSDLEAAIHGGQILAPTLAAVSAAAVGAPDGFDPNATQVFGAQTQPVPAAAAWAPTGLGEPHIAGANDEDEGGSRKTLMWVLIGVAALAIAALIFLFVINGKSEPAAEQTSVPSLSGMTKQDAEEALAKVDLKMKGYEEKSDVEKGLFVKSDPEPGTAIETGSTVEVWFSAGPNSTEVPDVTGKSQDEARKLLEAANLEVASSLDSETGGEVPKDHITRSDPESGKTVPAGSTVKLYISDGQVDVPDLLGLKEKKARDTIRALNAKIELEIVSEESDEKEGTVIEQRPAAGPIAQGSEVTIVIAKPMPPEQITVPSNLVGMTEPEAKAALEAVGLKGVVDPQESIEYVAGIVAGVAPQQGSLQPEGSEITLYVSTGPGPEPDEPEDGDTSDDGQSDGDDE